MVIRFYTDGACSKNPGPGGYACVVVMGSTHRVMSGNKENTTNNEMELMGVLKALQFVVRNDIHKSKHRAEIYSDSAYVVNSINQGWYLNWAKNGWRTKAGEPVKNLEIWQKIYELRKDVKFTMIKVKGHSDDYYNNIADAEARAQVQK